MIRELVHDPIFLGQKSEKATITDLQTAEDLLDTLTAHKDTCVGMAANMIGVNKRIICFIISLERRLIMSTQTILFVVMALYLVGMLLSGILFSKKTLYNVVLHHYLNFLLGLML